MLTLHSLRLGENRQEARGVLVAASRDRRREAEENHTERLFRGEAPFSGPHIGHCTETQAHVEGSGGDLRPHS